MRKILSKYSTMLNYDIELNHIGKNQNNMKVTLNIQDDAELRASIKEAIKGQVLAVTREEITEIVKSEIGKKIQNSDTQYLNRLINESMKSVLQVILYKEYGVDNWSNTWIEPIITRYLSDKVQDALKGKDWNTLVDTLAKQKVRELLK